MHIAVGGFQHETNTFAPHRAGFADFIAADAWPGLTRGPALIEAVQGINLPIAGFIAEAQSGAHRISPLTWCSATPSGRVTQDAFERICRMLIDDVRSLSHIDAVYLDLHGAMVAEHIDDADGELLRRVRAAIGPNTPLIASLDFHANVSELMLHQASALVSYRTYPHVDMFATGERAMRLLYRVRNRPLMSALGRLPFLIPLTSQCTLAEPLASIMSAVASTERDAIHAANFAPGFAAADVAKCGPAVFVHAEDSKNAQRCTSELQELVCHREAQFALKVYAIADALACLDELSPNDRPVILADTQDNPGGGGTSDTTSLLRALLDTHHSSVLCGLIFDPVAAARAHAAGVGTQVELQLGGHAGPAGETPLRGLFRVVALGDGNFTATGPFYRGARMTLGPMALVQLGNLYIAVSSRKQQAADQAMFRHLGAEPERFALLVLKSSVHFRADFGALAKHILIVAAPGANTANPAELRYAKLPPQMRMAGTRLPLTSPR
jgi:microcystin degradation protein MlrC